MSLNFSLNYLWHRKKDKNSQQHHKRRPTNNQLSDSRRNFYSPNKANKAKLHEDRQPMLHLVKADSPIHLKNDRKTLPFSYFLTPAQGPRTKPNYCGYYSLDGPENCSVSPNLSTSIHRIQFLENDGAGSRKGLARAHHILEDIFPTCCFIGKTKAIYAGEISYSPWVLNDREQAELGGDPASVQQGYTRWIPPFLGTVEELRTSTAPRPQPKA